MNLSAFQYNRRVLQIVAIAVPIVVAAVFYLVTRQLKTEQDGTLLALGRVAAERTSVAALSESLNAAESHARGYLLTGDARYLTPFRFARIEALILLPYLDALTLGQPTRARRFGEVRALVREKFAEMGRTVGEVGAGRLDEARQAAGAHAGFSLMQSIRAKLQALEVDEGTLLEARQKVSDAKLYVRDNISTGLLFLATAVVVGAGILLLRIQQLQSIITICAWTQRVNYHGRWMRMEEFLWERFRVKVSHGISEEAFDGVMGIVGNKLTVSDNRADRTVGAKEEDGHQPARRG